MIPTFIVASHVRLLAELAGERQQEDHTPTAHIITLRKCEFEESTQL